MQPTSPHHCCCVWLNVSQSHSLYRGIDHFRQTSIARIMMYSSIENVVCQRNSFYGLLAQVRSRTEQGIYEHWAVNSQLVNSLSSTATLQLNVLYDNHLFSHNLTVVFVQKLHERRDQGQAKTTDEYVEYTSNVTESQRTLRRTLQP